MQFSLNSQGVKVVTQIQEHRHPGGNRYFSFTKSKQFLNIILKLFGLFYKLLYICKNNIKEN